MDQFSYLELTDEAEQASPSSVGTSSYRLLEIPDNQYLNYLDLISLSPTPQSLKRVSRRLIEKYRFIPISNQAASMPVRLPGHLDPQFHIRYKSEQKICAYIAICPPKNEMPLRFIQNAVGYGLYGLPIKEATFERFMQEQYVTRTTKS